MGTVNTLTQSRIGQQATWLRTEEEHQAARAATRDLLVHPLSADDAVKVALLNNRSLQALYAELGIAEADLVQAGRLVNPGFAFSRLARGGDISIERTFLVNVLEAGYRRNSESSLPRETGYEIELRLPIFDWGGARVARAEYTYMQAVNRAADIAVRARSEVREAYAAYRTAHDLARQYRDEIVSLRKHISEEVLLRYNGML